MYDQVTVQARHLVSLQPLRERLVVELPLFVHNQPPICCPAVLALASGTSQLPFRNAIPIAPEPRSLSVRQVGQTPPPAWFGNQHDFIGPRHRQVSLHLPTILGLHTW